MTALHAPPVPAGRLEGAGMTRVLPFPSARCHRRRRARIEALVAHLIDLLDAPDADREPEPDEDADGEEASAAPLSLNNGGLAPPRRIHRNPIQGRPDHG